jgi:hypothetical protein
VGGRGSWAHLLVGSGAAVGSGWPGCRGGVLRAGDLQGCGEVEQRRRPPWMAEGRATQGAVAESSCRMRKRGSAVRPSLTCSPRTPVTTISIGPWAKSSPTGVWGLMSSIGSICTAWPGLLTLQRYGQEAPVRSRILVAASVALIAAVDLVADKLHNTRCKHPPKTGFPWETPLIKILKAAD